MPKNTQLQRIRRISAGALAAAAVLAGGISVQLHAAATSSTEAATGGPGEAVQVVQLEAPAVAPQLPAAVLQAPAVAPQARTVADHEWLTTTMPPLREGDRAPDTSTAGS